ncbi:porin [Oceanobacter kriegii]|uniref:porin n=1 Tax=Oceanobacter kriegii TaxID=64972 RepID=UPI000425DC31|nr:porin [Oceanobacter kriegii]
MKKQVLALAIAAATSAPAFAVEATTDFYGSLRLKLTDGSDSAMDVTNNFSRIGIKGSVETDLDNVKALYRYEVGVGKWDADDESATANEGNIRSRLAWVGLEGDFGTVKIGQDWTPYAQALTFTTDIMSSYSPYPFIAAHYRADSQISYYSPDFGGFSFAAATMTDTDKNTGENVDSFELTGTVKADMFTVSLGTIQEASDTMADVISLGVSMTAGDLYLGVLAEQLDDTDTTDSQTYLSFAAQYNVPTGAIAAYAYDLDDDAGSTGFAAEYQHSLGDATTVWVEFANDSTDDADDVQNYSVGLKVDF